MANPNPYYGAFMNNRPAILKLKDKSSFLVSVSNYGEDGFWVTSRELSSRLMQSFTEDVSSEFDSPLVFVPMDQIEWIVTPASR
jgi:hypothetical protein